jgi:hypothetical protein
VQARSSPPDEFRQRTLRTTALHNVWQQPVTPPYASAHAFAHRVQPQLCHHDEDERSSDHPQGRQSVAGSTKPSPGPCSHHGRSQSGEDDASSRNEREQH